MPNLTRSILALALCGTVTTAMSQTPVSSTLMMDSFVTRTSEIDPRARVDVYVAVPYEALQFERVQDTYVAQYTVHVVIRDSSSRKVLDTTYQRNVAERDYNTSRGATGVADRSARSVTLSPGRYRIEITVNDVFSKREQTMGRDLTVTDHTAAIPSLSSIIYLSEIEQRGERYRITPYIGDAIFVSDMTLFGFFEVYLDVPQRVGFSWRIATSDGRELARGLAPADSIPTRTAQRFVRLTLPPTPASGSYTLRIRMHPGKGAEVDTTVTIAERTRGMVIPRTSISEALSDLGKAIKQLRYVAQQSDIDAIEAGGTPVERQARFEAFWKTLDPTPNTVRNEAFDDYYGRIEQANKQYKSYAEGWLTDMGMVSIILGPPAAVDRYNLQAGRAMRVVWTYQNNMTFVFEDNTGFGDYRLRTPMPPGMKYRYR